MKNIVKCYKDFFGYFNALKTHCADQTFWRGVYKAQKVQKYALNSQLQALQILTNDDEVENWSLSSFLLNICNSSGAISSTTIFFRTFTNLVNGVQSLTDSAVDNHHSCDIYIFSMFAENEKQKRIIVWW